LTWPSIAAVYAYMTEFRILMIFLRSVISAVAVAVFFSPAQATEPADRQFEVLAQLPPSALHAKSGEKI